MTTVTKQTISQAIGGPGNPLTTMKIDRSDHPHDSFMHAIETCKMGGNWARNTNTVNIGSFLFFPNLGWYCLSIQNDSCTWTLIKRFGCAQKTLCSGDALSSLILNWLAGRIMKPYGNRPNKLAFVGESNKSDGFIQENGSEDTVRAIKRLSQALVNY